MSDTLIAALIGAGVSLFVTAVTLVITARIEREKSKLDIQQKEYQSKRECLNEVYKKLISIINLYPNKSPNSVMQSLKYPPGYSLEMFDAVINSLDYQIEDYKKQLHTTNFTSEKKYDIEQEIANSEYSKKIICEIRDKYHCACEKYKVFRTEDKAIFDMYAGQDVRNRLIEFEVVINNVFVAGLRIENQDDPLNNIIEIRRRNLIDSIRKDIGIY